MPESRSLPAPSPAALERSNALAARIRLEIERLGGWMPFDRYMQMALYEPELGYYAADDVKIGAEGDFTTAAELGSLLPRAIAAWCETFLDDLAAPVILELGAGSGALAAHLLDALASRGRDVRYRILEPSGSLRAQQRERLRAHASRVDWLERLPETPIEGLVLANEVVDALPVARFEKEARGTSPLGVSMQHGNFAWRTGPVDRELEQAVARVETSLPSPLAAGHRAEICLVLDAWIATLADCLGRGAMLLIDYGLPRRELYRADRSDGTLICHYRHRAHGDPFLWPGLQDLSAWVDFSACAGAGRKAGLDVTGFTTQAQFLLNAAVSGGIELDQVAERNAVKTLVLPGEMGERFKILSMTRGFADVRLPGRDLLGRL